MFTLTRLFAFILIFCAACSIAPEKKPTRLNISFNTQPTTLDPRKCGDFVSSTLICMLYEGLTRCSPEGSVEPALAKSFQISKDGKSYTFFLREAFWSDGKPITAYDFEASWKKNLQSPSLSAHLFYPIKNGEKCAKGEAPITDLGVIAIDEKTLFVELENQTPYFYSLTAFPNFFPFPSHIQSSENKEVYSGPFVIKKLVRNSEILLIKNNKFWNAGKTFLDEIHISIIPDEMTALQMFEQGELDWLGGPLSPLPPDALEAIKKQHEIHFISSAATTICTFNTESIPFKNVHLRKAFSLAIDRKEIVEKITALSQVPATSILPPTFLGANKFLFPLTDREGAKAELKKALQEIDPKELESLVLYFKPGQIDKRLAQTLQKQWKQVLGIQVKLVHLDDKSHAAKLQKRDYQIALSSWIAQFNDPVSILERFKSRTNLKNYPGWENTTYALLLEKAANSPQAIRTQLLERAEVLLADQMPITPIYHWSYPVLYSSKIEGVGATPCGGILFERFRLLPCK